MISYMSFPVVRSKQLTGAVSRICEKNKNVRSYILIEFLEYAKTFFLYLKIWKTLEFFIVYIKLFYENVPFSKEKYFQLFVTFLCYLMFKLRQI